LRVNGWNKGEAGRGMIGEMRPRRDADSVICPVYW